MNKTELVAAIADKTELTKKDSEKALKAFIDVVTEELKKKFEDTLKITSVKDKAMNIVNEVMPLVDKARFECDSIERHLSIKNHPYPSYEKLFFALDF